MRGLALAPVLALVVLSSCGDDPPPDVGGTYDVTVSTDDDGCDLAITEGASMMTLAQDVDDPTIISVEVDGAIAPFLGITVGGTTFSGRLSGRHVTVSRMGATRQEGGCTYHVNGDIDAVAGSDDTLTGTLTYEVDTNDAVDCVLVDNCLSTQSF